MKLTPQTLDTLFLSLQADSVRIERERLANQYAMLELRSAAQQAVEPQPPAEQDQAAPVKTTKQRG